MTPWLPWTLAALLYGAFRLWYDGIRRPLNAAEVDDLLTRRLAVDAELGMDPEALRAFLEADDGREFVMLNLVKLHAEPVPHPKTGEATPAPELIQGYMREFLPTLLKRGGIPLMQARKIGPYVDSWGTEPDPGWTIVGYMRYRSRRDLMELALDPRFQDGHGFKHAAIPATISFPTRPQPIGFLGPRVWVALVLALGAALMQLALA